MAESMVNKPQKFWLMDRTPLGSVKKRTTKIENPLIKIHFAILSQD
jgi:hypothetical protein